MRRLGWSSSQELPDRGRGVGFAGEGRQRRVDDDQAGPERSDGVLQVSPALERPRPGVVGASGAGP